MELKPGIFLQSTSLLNDTVFESAVIYIKQYDDEGGAVGVIINRTFERKLNDLQELKNSLSFPLYYGGPVATGHLFFIHQRPDIINDSDKIEEQIYWGGDFMQAVSAINNNTLTPKDLKIFIGYCGWDAAELEAEIAEGSWKILELPTAEIFR